MAVPDRICGLEVEHYDDGSFIFWAIETPEDWIRISLRKSDGVISVNGAYCTDLVEAVEIVCMDIRELAVECRAFADMVLGER